MCTIVTSLCSNYNAEAHSGTKQRSDDFFFFFFFFISAKGEFTRTTRKVGQCLVNRGAKLKSSSAPRKSYRLIPPPNQGMLLQ